jgi:hypothetical protein
MVHIGTDLARGECASIDHVWRAAAGFSAAAINSEKQPHAASTQSHGIGMNLAEKRAGAGESGLESAQFAMDS